MIFGYDILVICGKINVKIIVLTVHEGTMYGYFSVLSVIAYFHGLNDYRGQFLGFIIVNAAKGIIVMTLKILNKTSIVIRYHYVFIGARISDP